MRSFFSCLILSHCSLFLNCGRFNSWFWNRHYFRFVVCFWYRRSTFYNRLFGFDMDGLRFWYFNDWSRLGYWNWFRTRYFSWRLAFGFSLLPYRLLDFLLNFLTRRFNRFDFSKCTFASLTS